MWPTTWSKNTKEWQISKNGNMEMSKKQTKNIQHNGKYQNHEKSFLNIAGGF